MTRRASITLTALVLGAMGYIVYGSMARVQRTCQVCIEFNGLRRCATASGADDAEATSAAHTTACGPLANGMDESIRCQNQQPVSVTCGG